jgi:tRNA threonylcarbamoyl adenosine modification protein YjeE
MMREVISHNEDETRALAAEIAMTLGRGSCLTLEGEVGAGKTVFARALIQALCGEDTQVNSPTFTLVQTYPVVMADGSKLTLWHYDLYRLKHPAELVELALDEALDEGIVLMEWPEIAQDMLPASRLAIHIDAISQEQRHITLHHCR